MDINPPSIPVCNSNEFDGSNKKKRAWLLRNRKMVVDWRTEWRKSHDMSAARKEGKVSIRLRLVNPNLVIPEQVRLFKYLLYLGIFL